MTRKILLLSFIASLGYADEGMWLLNQFPKEKVQKKYGFSVTDQFLNHLQHASVRLSAGGSGSFVSPNGLIFTNHHVGSECIQNLSTEKNDLLKNGFSAGDFSEEKRCPDLEVNVLQQITEVTAEINKNVPSGASAAEVNRIRRSNTARIEKECSEKSGERCDVVSLFSGGRYDLYQYKKYTDIRLVFAPEFRIAFFGGDPDNFNFPRWVLDIAFFRAYENNQPAVTKNYLKWSKTGAKEGELTFVPGHPGTTQRLATVANLEFARDVQVPLTLHRLDTLLKAMARYGEKGPEQLRQRNDLYFSASNSYKAYQGFFSGLNDRGLMAKKKKDEEKLQKAVLGNPSRKEKYGDIWEKVAAAFSGARSYYKDYYCFEVVGAGGSSLMSYGRILLRASEELKKPDGDRLREYHDAAKPELEQALLSTAPVYPDLEVAVIAENLRFLSENLGADHPVIKQLLKGKSPQSVAEDAVKNSKLADVEQRKKLWNHLDQIKNDEEDGILQLVQALDGPARENRKKWEDGVTSALAVNAGKIAQARYEVYGASEYPDATFTLRLAYGPAKGYRDATGKKVSWATEIGGAYPHATGKDPFQLPDGWIRLKDQLNLKTPFNYLTTNDIHGGNSGSPTVNTKGEVIGIVFDGNMESLPNRYIYEDERARAIHVTSQGIIEALRKIYRADRVMKELGIE